MDSGIGTKDKITYALFCVLNLFAIVALHSCDYFMSGRSNQLITYCAERFMAALSV